MAFELSVNLEYMFHEAGERLEQRVADAVAPRLAQIVEFPQELDPRQLAAPLPRAWQWLDGSVYSAHGELMDQVIGS